MLRRSCLTAMLLLAGAPSVLWAHDFWMEPTRFRLPVGEPVPLTLRVGQDFVGTSQPYVPDWFTDYYVVPPEGGSLPILAQTGDDPAGSFTPSMPGLHVVGYRSARSYVELNPDLFRRYLAQEGMEFIEALREEQGQSEAKAREFYSRCVKALVQAGDATPRGGHDRPLGFTLELMPERNPYGMRPGDVLPVRLLHEGRPLAGALVVAFTRELPDEQQRLRTDAEGRVQLPLPRAGVWLVKAVHMVPVPPPNQRADWESFWASLTFELPAS